VVMSTKRLPKKASAFWIPNSKRENRNSTTSSTNTLNWIRLCRVFIIFDARMPHVQPITPVKRSLSRLSIWDMMTQIWNTFIFVQHVTPPGKQTIRSNGNVKNWKNHLVIYS
jgi:hypothetical protein